MRTWYWPTALGITLFAVIISLVFWYSLGNSLTSLQWNPTLTRSPLLNGYFFSVPAEAPNTHSYFSHDLYKGHSVCSIVATPSEVRPDCQNNLSSDGQLIYDWRVKVHTKRFLDRMMNIDPYRAMAPVLAWFLFYQNILIVLRIYMPQWALF